VNWRLLRSLRNTMAERVLREAEMKAISKSTAKKIVGKKDGKGRRLESENN
jgi:hypothetical protein